MTLVTRTPRVLRLVAVAFTAILMEGTPNEIKQSRDVVEAYLGNSGQTQE